MLLTSDWKTNILSCVYVHYHETGQSHVNDEGGANFLW